MAISPEDRKRYRSKRLRNGTNRPVSPRQAHEEIGAPDDVRTLNCTCGTHLVGTEADFEQHRRTVHSRKWDNRIPIDPNTPDE